MVAHRGRRDKGEAVRVWNGLSVGHKIPKSGYPTTAAPGTPEKLDVLEKRFSRKEPLFHPFDARFEGDRRPEMFDALGEKQRKRIIRRRCRTAMIVSKV